MDWHEQLIKEQIAENTRQIADALHRQEARDRQKDEPKYDYSYSSKPKSWEDRKAENEALHSVINFLLTLTFKVGVPAMLISGVVGLLILIKKLGFQQFVTGIQQIVPGVKELLSEVLLSEDGLVIVIMVGAVTLFFVLSIMVGCIKRCFKKTKKDEGNAVGANSGKITNQTKETAQEKKSINLVELAELQKNDLTKDSFF